MRYLILGLGIYGSNLARDLTDMGHEVIGVDDSHEKIDAIKDYISTVYMVDVTEEASLELLPLKNVDLVIVAIGENFGASVKVVAMLKKMGVKHIYARAIDSLHESILKGFEIDRIVTPEQRAARDLTFEMGLGAKVMTLAIDDDNLVVKFTAPPAFVGMRYSDINFQKSFKLTLVAVTKEVAKRNVMGITRPTPQVADLTDPDLTVASTDQLACFGSRSAFASLLHHLGQ